MGLAAGFPPPDKTETRIVTGTFWLLQLLLLVTTFMGSCGCGSTTDLARDVVAHVSPAASSSVCPDGTISAAGWCCASKPVPLCTPTADAFADGLSLPVDNTDAPMVKP